MVSIRRTWLFLAGLAVYAFSIFVIHRSISQKNIFTYVMPPSEKLIVKTTHMIETNGSLYIQEQRTAANETVKGVTPQPLRPAESESRSTGPSPASKQSARHSGPSGMKLLPPYEESLYPFTITSPSMCPPSTNVRLLVFVISSVKNTEIRTAIRKSWGSPAFNASSGFRLGFMVGVASNRSHQANLLEESRSHRDIVQVNYTEDYYKITVSSVSILRWVTQNCPRYEYLVKMDDDSFLMMASLYDYLSVLKPHRSILGRVVKNSGVNRNRKSKWYTTKEVYSKSRYPDFTNGFTYVITSDAVPSIYEAARSSKYLFPLEDVFITGMCREIANVTVIMIPQMSRMIVRPEACLYKDAIARHRVSPQVMQSMWKKLESNDFKCKRGKKG
ncbi:beta-1,3-galactosyltransferase 5-like [Ornithodoros turicata]|uniref:beta-1,3-galactosyltransferase 5-like n=1 Tax=Ornithodoros turicata TaxID=34597 RepID=UPI003138ADBD